MTMLSSPVVFSSFVAEMQKIAEDEKKSPYGDLARIVGSGALGFGVGTAAGIGAGHLADLISESATGRRIPKSIVYGAAPLLSGATGIAYAVHKAKEQEAIRRALENSTKSGPG